MSQRVWLVSGMAAALGVLGIAVERSRSQESSQEVSQPRAEASGDPGEGAATADDPFGDFGGRNYHRGGRARGEDNAARPGAAPVPAAPRIWVAEDPERIQRIDEILKRPLPSAGLDFAEGTPLEEIVAYLSEEYDIPIVLDTVALDELGIGADEPIAINLRNVRLDQSLRRMLEPLELTYVVDNGVLLVTSEEEALTKLRLAIYDVRDLLLQGDYDSLIEIITATIASDTWAENGGGEAEIRAYPQRGSLVISQTSSVHDEILGLFDALRSTSMDPDAKPLTEPARVSAERRAGPHCVFGPAPKETGTAVNEEAPQAASEASGALGYEKLLEALRHLDSEKRIRKDAGDNSDHSHLNKAYGLIYDEANRRGAGIFSIRETPIADMNVLNGSE